MLNKSQIAGIITSTLPYINKFRGKIFVIKYGGSAQIDSELKDKFAQDITLLHMVGIKTIVVHGGGKDINFYLDKFGVKSEFKDGLRVTTKDSIDVIEMVLSGKINKEITSLLNSHGAKAIGISGKDFELFKAAPLNESRYGLVGDITNVDVNTLNYLLNGDFVPVIAPIASGENSQSYNVNADLCAASVARALKADKIIFLSDIQGVLDKESKLISNLDFKKIKELKDDGTISGGMIPKIDACVECIKSGVKSAHIIDGKIAHSLLLEIFTDKGIGSLIQ